MTTELISSLRQVAGGREILVPGGGNAFQAVRKPVVTTASVRVKERFDDIHLELRF
ncbi:MAG TPA: hypothetical protein VNU92_17230 [Edaphobacter sp.]|jgi:hypothetical protein|nr:hypothetical protein [Edaphobacter sp.]